MGCLLIKSSLDYDLLNAEISLASHSLSLQNISVTCSSEPINIAVGIVCTPANDLYLRVSPKEVQWITSDLDIIYNVMSNTEWEIK